MLRGGSSVNVVIYFGVGFISADTGSCLHGNDLPPPRCDTLCRWRGILWKLFWLSSWSEGFIRSKPIRPGVVDDLAFDKTEIGATL